MLIPHYFDPSWIVPSGETLRVDLCVYGGNAAGVVAAIKAARLGRRVALLHPGVFLGGLTTGGLSWTDFGRQAAIGGMSREFYRRCGRVYGREIEWRFEPKVARQVLEEWLAETGVEVRLARFLEGVEREGPRLRALRCLGGSRVEAACFLDTTYEGDLLAAAGVTYTVGRESNAQYGETLNGFQCMDKHQFDGPVDPYRVPGDPASGLLPHVRPDDGAPIGQGDRRVQAYNFRVCLTDDPGLRVPFPRPVGYDPDEYVLLKRWLRITRDDIFHKFDRLCVPAKTDTNNHGAVSSDYIGANWDYPEAGYARREEIFQAHRIYQQGYHWTMANDPEVPAALREAYARWGLAGDEFVETGHWPHQLYVREARRMVSDYVVTEGDCRGTRRAEDSVGLGSYNMDSHNCSRIARDGRVYNEGDVQVPPTAPYPVSYRAVLPPRGQADNLLVPVCFSCSHIAYGSARMEPVFMILGESCALAAHLALAEGVPLHDLPYPALRAELLAAGQVL